MVAVKHPSAARRLGTSAFVAAGCQPVTPCKHSGTGRDSTPRVLCFEIAWLAKQARSSFLRHESLMEHKIVATWECGRLRSVGNQ